MPEKQIPILNLAAEVDMLWPELNTAIQEVLLSSQFIMGEAVHQLEQELAAYLGVKHAIGVNSGTDALVIGLKALGIGPGDEVITTPFTFFATAEAISILGAIPVFVDVDLHTYNLDVNRLAEKITPRTKAILPVHLFGLACDMDLIMALAEQYGLYVIEDTAQAFGGTYKGQKLGTIGHLGAFSFFPTKNLGAYGDAGLVATNDDRVADIARMLHTHGGKKKYHNEILGYNSRLDTLQAAILRVKLRYVDQWNAQRREAAKRYDALLANMLELITPTELSTSKHVYHQYTVRVVNGQRDEVCVNLAKAGVGTMIYYPIPVHQLPIYQDLNLSMPQAEALASEVLSLPMGPYLTSEEQMYIAEKLSTILASQID